MTEANTCAYTNDPSTLHTITLLRVSFDTPDTDTRMVQHVCTACFADTGDMLKDLGATRIVWADEHNETRILAALQAAAGGAIGKIR